MIWNRAGCKDSEVVDCTYLNDVDFFDSDTCTVVYRPH
jgi:hypothetical protein